MRNISAEFRRKLPNPITEIERTDERIEALYAEIQRLRRKRERLVEIVTLLDKTVSEAETPKASWEDNNPPKTIEEMVLFLVENAEPVGLSTAEIHEAIKKKWRPTQVKSTINSTVARLSRHAIYKDREASKWRVTND